MKKELRWYSYPHSVDDTVLKKTVEEEGYEVTGIR